MHQDIHIFHSLLPTCVWQIDFAREMTFFKRLPVSEIANYELSHIEKQLIFIVYRLANLVGHIKQRSTFFDLIQPNSFDMLSFVRSFCRCLYKHRMMREFSIWYRKTLSPSLISLQYSSCTKMPSNNKQMKRNTQRPIHRLSYL